MKRRSPVLRILGVVAISALLAGIILFFAWNKPRPRGTEPAAEAERIAREMLRSVNADAWKETGAVQFTFMKHRHLWDRRRGYDRIEYDGGKTIVLLRIRDRSGKVVESGKAVPDGKRAAKLIAKGYADWVNDSFWLNPIVKIYDAGVSRKAVRSPEGHLQLLVEYSAGGLTPGDAYLWTPGYNGVPPVQWQMWTSNLPLGGVPASWENWITLPTGARVSTLHRIGPFKLKIEPVNAARSLRELLGTTAADPFAELAAK